MKHIEDLLVVKNTALNPYYFLLELRSESKLPNILPGNFVNVLVQGVSDRILRRPISIHDVNYERNSFSLVVQKIGKATQQLSLIKKGESLSVVSPLGNSFPLDYKRPLLMGGGVGIAPLYYLAKCYNEKGIRPYVVYGAKTKELLFATKEFSKISNLYISTEDGSESEKGFLTQNSLLEKDDFDCILTCGPTIMMKNVNDIAKKKNVPCFVSLENRMACGIGACLCCVVDTIEGNVCTCTEGAVFNAKDLKEF